MKIIEHGHTNSTVIIRTRCPECGCIFEFVDKYRSEDGDLYHSRAFCGDYVDCPDCEEEIMVHNTSSTFDDPDKVVCVILDENNEIIY